MKDFLKNNPLLLKPTNFFNVKCIDTKLDVINTTNARLPNVEYHSESQKKGLLFRLFGWFYGKK